MMSLTNELLTELLAARPAPCLSVYRVVNRIRGEFEVIENAYDDDIAQPKPDGHQSLHLTVISAIRQQAHPG